MSKKRPNQSNKKTGQNSNRLRIIAGQWRGRKLDFATAPDLRPTPDRVRETLFNWLQGHLRDARCLDLFAGSGALSFEALSRGAKQVTLVENNPQAIKQLRENIQLLQTEKAELYQADAFLYMENLEPNLQPFDLIFLDPPFRQSYLPKLLTSIIEKKLLSPEGLVYLEDEKGRNTDLDIILEQFTVIKEKTAGQVISRLIKFVN